MVHSESGLPWQYYLPTRHAIQSSGDGKDFIILYKPRFMSDLPNLSNMTCGYGFKYLVTIARNYSGESHILLSLQYYMKNSSLDTCP